MRSESASTCVPPRSASVAQASLPAHSSVAQASLPVHPRDSATTCVPPRGTAAMTLRSALIGRLADYLDLTRPRIALMVLVTVLVGYALASSAGWQTAPLIHALAGVALVAAGTSALNQLIEWRSDALMDRTAERPLPAGRLLPGEVLLFGVAAGAGGCLYLATFVNLLTAALAAMTLVLYVAVYTPLKSRTAACTAVGAVSGALPPVLGWTAAGGRLDGHALILFAILYLWQFPHFLAIGWLYRREYASAGLRMLPAGGRIRGVTGLAAVSYAALLLPVSLLPGGLAMSDSLAGGGYLLAASVLGLGYLACAVRFLIVESRRAARGLLWASLVYLPLLLAALTWDHFRLLK